MKFHVTLDGFSSVHDLYRVGENDRQTFDNILNNLRDIRDQIKTSTFKIVIKKEIALESYVIEIESVGALCEKIPEELSD